MADEYSFGFHFDFDPGERLGVFGPYVVREPCGVVTFEDGTTITNRRTVDMLAEKAVPIDVEQYKDCVFAREPMWYDVGLGPGSAHFKQRSSSLTEGESAARKSLSAA